MKPALVWILLCVIWGTTWIFIKLGLEDLPPFTFAALRFVVACLILLPILIVQKVSLPNSGRQWALIVVTGLMQFFVNYGLLFWGEQFISSGLASVLQATIPAFGLLLARIYIPEEKITVAKIIAIVLGIVGIYVIFSAQLVFNGQMALWGSAAVVVGAFAASYASVLTKAKGSEMKPAGLVFWQMLVGITPLTLTGLVIEGNPLAFSWTLRSVLCVLYLAVLGSIAAFWLYYWLLSQIDVTKAMMIAFVTPLVAVFIGSYYGEIIDRRTFAGALLVLLSVLVIVLTPMISKRRSSAA